MAPQPFGPPPPRRRLNVHAPEGEASDAAAAGSAPPVLSGWRVVDLSTWIGGAYCTKLLADGGAEVIKVELPEGDPLRRWSASGAAIPADGDGALFNFLGASKRSLVIDGTEAGGLDALHGLLDSADAVVWSRGSPLAEQPSLHPREVMRSYPHLIVTSITPFGLDGPWSDKPATEFTLQAWSGGIVGLARGSQNGLPSSSAAKSGSGSPASTVPSARCPPVDVPRSAVSSSTSPRSRRWRCASPITR